MKKNLFTISAIVIPSMAMALISNPPADIRYCEGMYGLKISKNGKWVGSMAGDASIYNIENDRLYDYWGSALGLGNCIADNGLAVGDANDRGVLLYEGEFIFPETLSGFWLCDIQAITPDGSRITGVVNNPSRGLRYVPFYCEVDEDMNVGEINILPYPTRDFYGTSPQSSTAVWISDDGKTIVGEMVDGRGMYTVPVVYCEDENGKWSYLLPSEQLFNPTDLPLPRRDNNNNQPRVPQFTDYMNDAQRMAYQSAYDIWAESGYNEYYWPNPVDFMTEENAAAYNKAVEEYNKWAQDNDVNGSMKSYDEAYNEIKKFSPSFSQNEFCIHPSGEFIMSHGTLLKEDGFEQTGYIYKFYIPSLEYEIIELPEPFSPYPSQILSDGTMIATTRLMEAPTSFILENGSKELMPFFDYVDLYHGDHGEWFNENLPGGTGLVSMSDDKRVILGALIPDQLADFDYEFSPFYYSTYIWMPGIDLGGVETLVASPEDGIYRVYNLEGVKVLETKDAEAVNELPKGIYIVNGKKVMVR